MNQKLGKANKIKQLSQINKLFQIGKWINKKYLSFLFIKNNVKQNFNFKCGVIVSKKKIKKSVDRNRVKRIMRECIRLNKKKLYNIQEQKLLFLLIYQSNIILKLKELELEYLQILEEI